MKRGWGSSGNKHLRLALLEEVWPSKGGKIVAEELEALGKDWTHAQSPLTSSLRS